MGRTKRTRRDALKLAGSALAGFGVAGKAAGVPAELVRANVGYRSQRGWKAARGAADDVLHRFNFDALTVIVAEPALDGLASRDDIRYVERDGRMEAIAQTLPWGVDRVDAEVAHANGETGAGADVAIIDTGIDATHPDLQANLGEGRAFVAGRSHPVWQDDNGHGTHVAGTTDAVDDEQGVVGVSTESTLHAVKVLTGAGTGFTSDVAKGIEYTADQGWHVGNMSLGGGDSDVLREAVEYADAKGVLLVAAAGNDGPCGDCVSYPAAYPECVAVSATDQNDDLAEFSSTGPEVEIAAPGADIESTFLGGSYTTLSGTSMASPHVAGAGAQLVADGYSSAEARDRLRETAEDVGLEPNEQGAGLVDVAAALGYDSSDDLSEDAAAAPGGAITDVAEVETPNPHAEFDVSWHVSDDDGDLEQVTLSLRDVTATEYEGDETISVDGSGASGTASFRAHKDDGSGHEYEMRLHVRDSNGNWDTDSATVTESE